MGRRKSVISMYSASSQAYESSFCCFAARKISGLTDIPAGLFKKSPKEPKSTLLTGQQRLSIIRTWRKIASDIGQLGISAMNKMLDLESDAKLLFEFSDKNDTDMQHDRRFRQHAFWLIQAVNAVLENLDRLDETVAHMFKQIGEKHAGIPRFHISYFGLLPDVWDYVWEEHLKERYSQHMQTSWDRIFQYIVDRLAEGYYLRIPYEPTAGPSSESTFSLFPNRSQPSPSSIMSITSSCSCYSISERSRTLTLTPSMHKTDSKASHKSKKGSAGMIRTSDSLMDSRMSISLATQSRSQTPTQSSAQSQNKSQMSVRTFNFDLDIGSTEMESSGQVDRKRTDSKASTRTKGSRRGSPRKLSKPSNDCSTSSFAKPRKTSATSEPTPGNDVTSAAQAPSHNNPPPSEEPVVLKAGKGPSPKQKKGGEMSIV